MAYIDKDKVIQLLRTDVAKYYPTTFLNGILASAREIEKMSIEDVVPRSEVEELQKTCDLFSETIQEMDKEIERLKVSDASKEECTIRQHCEIKELKAELSKAKQKVAREIFDVLDKKKRYLMKSNNYNLFKASIDFFDHIDDFVGLTGEEILAEIEKKYTGEVTENEQT